MSIQPAPLIDSRSRAELSEQTRRLLCHYLAPYGWQVTDDGGEAGRALTGVFAHMSSQVVERINRAPDLNLMAFLALLGHAPIPPTPASVPLSFVLDPDSAQGVNLPAGTQVQASPAPGDNEPLTFETDQDLWLTTLQLKALDKSPARPGLAPRDMTRLIVTASANVLERPDKHEGLFDQDETFQFGFDLASGLTLPVNTPVTLYFFIDQTVYDAGSAPPARSPATRVSWTYLNDQRQWASLVVQDDTDGLTRSGAVSFLVPRDISRTQRHLFERKLFWIRAGLVGDQPATVYAPAPKLKGVVLNTTLARQQLTRVNEVLGSSNGQPHQRLRTFKRPVLPGQSLSVLERRDPRLTDDAQLWTPWFEVDTFHASQPMDRHYTIDRANGEIQFGNGQQGMIPPIGIRNIRLDVYRSGGGVSGNLSQGSLQTLVTSLRQVRQVTNHETAQGGADSEALSALLNRAPRTLRHRGRAVTQEDYEDLARLSSTGVARAMCVPLIDLAQHPCAVINDIGDEVAGAGHVSVIVVPQSTAVRPLPSQALLDQVRDKLLACSLATASLSVVGPLYLRVDVQIKVRLRVLREAQRVQHQVEALLNAYLHPLTGRNGQGWPFGRQPFASDIHQLLRDVPGIDHVSSLTLQLSANERPLDCPGNPTEAIAACGRFLIHAGTHTVTVS